MPIAADYPFMGILWSTLIFMAFLMWIWIAIAMFSDIFRRHDMGGFAKALWIILIICIPFVGVLIYVIAFHKGIADRNAQGAEDAHAQFERHVRETAVAGGGAADEIQTAQQLLDAGTITQAEFDGIKSKALAG